MLLSKQTIHIQYEMREGNCVSCFGKEKRIARKEVEVAGAACGGWGMFGQLLGMLILRRAKCGCATAPLC
jgi:hypothetical protein